MTVSLYQIVVDSHEPSTLARFWAQVLDWRVLFETEDEVIVGADERALPGFCFVPVPASETKTVKNRLHIDLAPDDLEAEVARILALGARRVDIGQGEDVPWTVLADPEGNEFCVLTPKNSLVD